MKNPAKRALVTGITGQDGSYLAELLLLKGYEVHGLIRRSSSFNTGRIDHVYQDPHQSGARLFLHYGDLMDASGLGRLLRSVGPEEVYNLGAQSHVRISFDMPIYTADTVAMGALRLLEAVRAYRQESGRDVRYYQASSSEMYGKAGAVPQDENTAFHPRSPYGCAKACAHMMTVNYRESYGLHASCGILFNHESPRRGETFVTRKITRAVGRIKHGLQRKLFLGNLEAKRDWGFAGDFVEAMWLMLQQPEPGVYVVATGETHSVREFCRLAFAEAGLDWRDFIEFDPRYLRPAEVDLLLGDPAKARTKLRWRAKVGFRDLIKLMVEADLELAARERVLKEAGHALPFHSGHDLDPVGGLIASTRARL